MRDEPAKPHAAPVRRCRHRAIADLLRERLVSGPLQDGMKLPPLRQLASELDVSVMTVREALGVLEKEGHVHRIPAVGTFARRRQPAQSKVQLKTIALSMEDLCSPLEVAIARSVDKKCHDLGWCLQVFDARSSWEIDARNLARLPTSSTRGGIIFPIHFGENINGLYELKKSGYPFVLIDRAVQGIDVDFVETDNAQGAYRATEYLIRRGHRRVLMVTDPPMVSATINRIRGYERALIDNGIVPQPEWKAWIDLAASHRGFEQGKRNLGGLLATLAVLKEVGPGSFPLAIFALNDFIAWGVVEACRELGLHIPGDASVVCFDDSEIIQAVSPPLTCIAQQVVTIGETAVDLLLKRIEDSQAPARHVQVEAKLIERGSVRTVEAA